MKIIDLLNKIANGEEVPLKIKINGVIFEYQGDDYLFKEKDKKEHWLFSDGYTNKCEWLDSFLKTKVEILEEEKKIPEKLDIGKMLQTKKWKRDKKTWETINLIIDYLKSKGE